jgi:hypothetical protein
MAIDDGFQIAGEVAVKCHGGTVRFGQGDGFGEIKAGIGMGKRLLSATACRRPTYGQE